MVVGNALRPTVLAIAGSSRASPRTRRAAASRLAIYSAKTIFAVTSVSISDRSAAICDSLSSAPSAYVSRRCKLRAMCLRWKPTDGRPCGRAFSSSSVNDAHHFFTSSSASSSACKTPRPTAGTSVQVPRSQGSVGAAIVLSSIIQFEVPLSRDAGSHENVTFSVSGRLWALNC